jgi:hypothetical protein
MGRLRVKHCVLNRTTRQYGSHPASDLLEVDYFYTVPADTEFPRVLGRLELFLRLLARDKLQGRLLITVSTHGTDEASGRVIFRRRVLLPTVVSLGPILVDKPYKLMNVVVPAEGTYVVRVLRRQKTRSWDGKARWRLLATEHFYVERAT